MNYHNDLMKGAKNLKGNNPTLEAEKKRALTKLFRAHNKNYPSDEESINTYTSNLASFTLGQIEEAVEKFSKSERFPSSPDIFKYLSQEFTAAESQHNREAETAENKKKSAKLRSRGEYLKEKYLQKYGENHLNNWLYTYLTAVYNWNTHTNFGGIGASLYTGEALENLAAAKGNQEKAIEIAKNNLREGK